MTSTAAVEPVLAGALQLVTAGAPLSEVASALMTEPPAPPAPQEVPGFPALPPADALSPEARIALKLLPGVFGNVSMQDRRQLTEDELADLGREDAAVRLLLDALKTRKEHIAAMIRHHADVTAEKSGEADPATTPRDEKGHYLLAARKGEPHRVHIPGTPRDWSLEMHEGEVSYDAVALGRLRDEGSVPWRAYEGMTSRVVDPVKAAEYIRRHPAEGLAALRGIVRRKPPANYLFVRKAK